MRRLRQIRYPAVNQRGSNEGRFIRLHFPGCRKSDDQRTRLRQTDPRPCRLSGRPSALSVRTKAVLYPYPEIRWGTYHWSGQLSSVCGHWFCSECEGGHLLQYGRNGQQTFFRYQDGIRSGTYGTSVCFTGRLPCFPQPAFQTSCVNRWSVHLQRQLFPGDRRRFHNNESRSGRRRRFSALLLLQQ